MAQAQIVEATTMAKVLQKGKRYTLVKFYRNVYGLYGTLKYQAGTEHLIPTHEVPQYCQ